MKITDEALDRCFAELERAAVAGERCPHNEPDRQDSTIRHELVQELARCGRIRTEIGVKNWRTVVIMTGPNAGKSTKECPWAGSKRGKQRTYGPQPSAPRSFA